MAVVSHGPARPWNGLTPAPCEAANARRNADAMWWRRWRWKPARDALWRLLDRHVPAGATVAVVGAGTGHDLPLRRLAGRSRRVDLIDVDRAALVRARRRLLAGRKRLTLEVLDVTFGAADAAVRRSCGGDDSAVAPQGDVLSRAPYDVVIADLLYTQLLYPALLDAGLPGPAIDAALRRDGQPLTDAVVARLHASAPQGTVIHLHDVLGWWLGHEQPFSPTEILELAQRDPDGALALGAEGDRPLGCDVRRAVEGAGARTIDSALWLWPFAPGVDYLVDATVATGAPH
jgi:hypothetical protein